MGYNTSPLASFLLTLFNVRLGWWFPNPGKRWWNRQTLGFGGKLLFSELFGLAGEDSKVVNVSDGGHFENLAIYELIRRRAKIIIASDGECDPGLTFGSLGNLIRICETDFGQDRSERRFAAPSGRYQEERRPLRGRRHHLLQRQPRISDLSEGDARR
jgi:hypothetical protein